MRGTGSDWKRVKGTLIDLDNQDYLERFGYDGRLWETMIFGDTWGDFETGRVRETFI